MSKEELLEKAKRDYPPGTKFYPAHISQEDIAVVPTEGEIKDVGENIGVFETGTCVYYNTPKGWSMVIYYCGHWAKIIPTPNPKLNLNYLIL